MTQAQLADCQSLGDQWVARYGETMSKADAARMLGISRWTVYKHVNDGKYLETGDHQRVFTRSVAAYMETGIPQGKPQAAIQPKSRKDKPSTVFRV